MIYLLAIPIIIITILYFAFRCQHELECFPNLTDDNKESRDYWHKHSCKQCGRTRDVLNVDCERFRYI